MDDLPESLQLPPHIIHVDFLLGDLDILQNRTEFDKELSESLHQFRVDRHPDVLPVDHEHDLRKGNGITLCLTIEFGDYLQSDKDIAFPEGHEATIEGIGIIKGTDKRAEAEAFIDFILTEGQAETAIANSMYPVNDETVLPDAYEWAPVPDKVFSMDPEYVAANIDRWTEEWTQAMTSL